ncbi:MAG: FG-GAP-like repeat-containing protein [Marinifilaceae bacterium]|jgi:gliding motility-associated-like protein|nr:FG-GAP-like repeat-containing protein [Marinifilaceae bacterium]
MNRLVLITLFCISFLNSFGSLDSKVYTGLPILSNTKLSTADFNLDGQVDIIISGEMLDRYYTAVLLKDADNFVELSLPELNAISNASISIIDINNDNYPDFMISGRDYDGNLHNALFKNINGLGFKKTANVFPQLSASEIAVLDINSDGFQDIIYAGYTLSNEPKTYTYINQKNENFKYIDLGLIDVGSPCIRPADYNNDSYTDILISGIITGNSKISYLYKNNSGESLTKEYELEGISEGDAQWCDFNLDGKNDLVILGDNGHQNLISIYQNNILGFNKYFSKEIAISNISMVCMELTDDKLIDIIAIGETDTGLPKTISFENKLTKFESANIISKDIGKGDIAVADFNSDNQKDLIIFGVSNPEGNIINAFEFKRSINFTKPNKPQNISIATKFPDINIQWENPIGDTNYTKTLQYTIRLGSTIDKTEYYSCSSNSITGNFSANFPVSNSLCKKIYNLKEGKYYVSVQCIDQYGNRSEFSDSKMFYLNKDIDLGAARDICKNDKLEIDFPTGNYICNWYDKNGNPIILNSNKISYRITDNENIRLELIKDYGAKIYDILNINCREHPTIKLKDEYYACKNADLRLESKADANTFIWKNSKDEIISNTNYINIINTNPQSLNFTATNKYLCSSAKTIDIKSYKSPDLELNAVYKQCKGDKLEINIPNTGIVSWKGETGSTLADKTNNLEYEFENDTQISVTITDLNSCQTTKKAEIQILELPKINAGIDSLLCNAKSIKLGETAEIETKSKLSFQWTDLNTNKIYDGLHPLVSVDKKTEYQLKVTDEHNCISTDNIIYDINNITKLSELKDLQICQGESIELGGQPTATGSKKEYSYKWTPIETLDDPLSSNPLTSPDKTIVYDLEVSTNNCPSIYSKQRVNVIPIPTVESISDTIVGRDEKIELWAKGGESYIWEPSYIFENNTLANPKLASSENIQISVKAVNGELCLSEEKLININVDNLFFIPKLFSPNGDGKNDNFMIYGTGLEELELNIFNSWGRIVFHSNDSNYIQNTGWNGQTKGKKEKEGNYLWELKGKYSNGNRIHKTGSIYLMR